MIYIYIYYIVGVQESGVLSMCTPCSVKMPLSGSDIFPNFSPYSKTLEIYHFIIHFGDHKESKSL